MLFFIICMAKHRRPHLRSGTHCVKLFISKIVYISLSQVFVFFSKRRFLPEFTNKVQEPFGQVVRGVSQLKVAWRRETVKVIICGELLENTLCAFRGKKKYWLHSHFIVSLFSLWHLAKIETSCHNGKWHRKICISLWRTLVELLHFCRV